MTEAAAKRESFRRFFRREGLGIEDEPVPLVYPSARIARQRGRVNFAKPVKVQFGPHAGHSRTMTPEEAEEFGLELIHTARLAREAVGPREEDHPIDCFCVECLPTEDERAEEETA